MRKTWGLLGGLSLVTMLGCSGTEDAPVQGSEAPAGGESQSPGPADAPEQRSPGAPDGSVSQQSPGIIDASYGTGGRFFTPKGILRMRADGNALAFVTDAGLGRVTEDGKGDPAFTPPRAVAGIQFYADLAVTDRGFMISGIGAKAGSTFVARVARTGERDGSFNFDDALISGINPKLDTPDDYQILPVSNGFILGATVWTSYERLGLRGTANMQRVGLLKLGANGAFDTKYGAAGTARIQGGTDMNLGYEAAAQKNGAIVVAGPDYADNTYKLHRFTASGQMDTAFGHPLLGKKTDDFMYPGLVMALDAQDRVLILNKPDGRPIVTRFSSNGTVDASFGTNGRVSLDLPELAGENPVLYGIAAQPDDRIVVALKYGANGELRVVRLDAKGGIDSSFGKNGWSEKFHLGPGAKSSVKATVIASKTPVVVVTEKRIFVGGEGTNEQGAKTGAIVALTR